MSFKIKKVVSKRNYFFYVLNVFLKKHKEKKKEESLTVWLVDEPKPLKLVKFKVLIMKNFKTKKEIIEEKGLKLLSSIRFYKS